MQGRMGSTVLLEDRLRHLEETITEPSTRSYVGDPAPNRKTRAQLTPVNSGYTFGANL